jgi:hypothetical protein
LPNTIYNFHQLCGDVKKCDPLIRFAGVINDRGHLVAGGMKDDLKPLENESDNEMLYMELALRIRMRREFDEQLGKVSFSQSIREKVLCMSFPIRDDILFVVAEKEANFAEVPLKILNLIKQSKNK